MTWRVDGIDRSWATGGLNPGAQSLAPEAIGRIHGEALRNASGGKAIELDDSAIWRLNAQAQLAGDRPTFFVFDALLEALTGRGLGPRPTQNSLPTGVPPEVVGQGIAQILHAASVRAPQSPPKLLYDLGDAARSLLPTPSAALRAFMLTLIELDQK
jgi:hypothetical protein